MSSYRPFSNNMEIMQAFTYCAILVGKFNKLIVEMPTTCVVVNCHNRQHKGCNISFYRFPVDHDRCRKWVGFVSCQNEDGSPWQPGYSDRICSDHFILIKKSDIPNNPDYVPSIQSPCSSEGPERVQEKGYILVLHRCT